MNKHHTQSELVWLLKVLWSITVGCGGLQWTITFGNTLREQINMAKTSLNQNQTKKIGIAIPVSQMTEQKI